MATVLTNSNLNFLPVLRLSRIRAPGSLFSCTPYFKAQAILCHILAFLPSALMTVSTRVTRPLFIQYAQFVRDQGCYNNGGPCHFTQFSLLQETALPTLLADPPQNIIAQSQSGTGKTAAFVLSMLSRVDHTKNYPQVSIPPCDHLGKCKGCQTPEIMGTGNLRTDSRNPASHGHWSIGRSLRKFF